jgi:hypothetical protein
MNHTKDHLTPLSCLLRGSVALIATLLATASVAPLAVAGFAQHGDQPDGHPSDAPLQPIRPVAADQAQNAELADPTGTDPLTPSEVNLVLRVSLNSPQIQQARVRAQAAFRAARPQALDDVQYLYAQRYDEAKDAPPDLRRANAIFYNYANDEVIHQIVNVKTGDVEEIVIEQGNGNQPAVTSIESNTAIQLILDHATLGPALRKMHQQATGQTLADASQVRAQGGIFFVDSAIGSPLEPITVICKYHRCVQLFIPYNDTHFIDASNLVVDLSAGQLLWADEALKVYINETEARTQLNIYLPIVAR